MILKALYDYYNRCGDDIVPMDMAYVDFYYSLIPQHYSLTLFISA